MNSGKIMVLCDRIKEIRKAIGLTQVKFADRIAISSSYLAEIEHSVKIANERVLRLIVAEFNVNEHWLRTGEGEMFNLEVDVQVAKITSLFKSLNPMYQECALIQLNALSDLQKLNHE